MTNESVPLFSAHLGVCLVFGFRRLRVLVVCLGIGWYIEDSGFAALRWRCMCNIVKRTGARRIQLLYEQHTSTVYTVGNISRWPQTFANRWHHSSTETTSSAHKAATYKHSPAAPLRRRSLSDSHRPRRENLFSLPVVSRELGAEDVLYESPALVCVSCGRAAATPSVSTRSRHTNSERSDAERTTRAACTGRTALARGT